MEPAVYLAAITQNANDLVDAAEQAGPDAPVPSCPKWVAADLLVHIGTVHRWAASNTQRSPGESFLRPTEIGIEAPPGPERPRWVRDGAAALVQALDRSPDDAVWTFAPPSTIAFWQRRQAHETAMHRIDAQLAAGRPTAIDALLAADGIDEFLTIIPARPWAPPITGNGETIHLHCTDVDGEWLIRLAPTGFEVERVHAKGDVAVRGSASELLCWLSRRTDAEPLEVFGSESVLADFRERVRF